MIFKIIHDNLFIAYCIKDHIGNDHHTGIFAVFDGHGGRQVADHCAERMNDELKKEIVKNAGDLSSSIEQVFLKVIIFALFIQSLIHAFSMNLDR